MNIKINFSPIFSSNSLSFKPFLRAQYYVHSFPILCEVFMSVQYRGMTQETTMKVAHIKVKLNSTVCRVAVGMETFSQTNTTIRQYCF